MQRGGVHYLGVRVLGPGFQDSEPSGIEPSQLVEAGLHTRCHLTCIVVRKFNGRIAISDKLACETGRVAVDVVDDRSAYLHLFPVRIAVSQLERVGDRLLGVVELRSYCLQRREGGSESSEEPAALRHCAGMLLALI